MDKLKLIKIVKSSNKDKKLTAYFNNDKKVDFGASGYEDFTKHKDVLRKKRYDLRHKSRENWKDPTSRGALSKYILWNKPTLKESIKDFKKRFDL